jgi:hypothetical protein
VERRYRFKLAASRFDRAYATYNVKGLLFQQLVVIGVMANPNPDNQVAFSMRHSAIMDTDSGRIEARVSFQMLEMKRTVIRIRQPKPITLVS